MQNRWSNCCYSDCWRLSRLVLYCKDSPPYWSEGNCHLNFVLVKSIFIEFVIITFIFGTSFYGLYCSSESHIGEFQHLTFLSLFCFKNQFYCFDEKSVWNQQEKAHYILMCSHDYRIFFSSFVMLPKKENKKTSFPLLDIDNRSHINHF